MKNIFLLLGIVALISTCCAQNEGGEAAAAATDGPKAPRRDHGVPPNVIIQVPISFGETQTEIVLHENEQPDDAAREFCVKHNIDVSNSAQLVSELEKRLPPLVASVPLSLGNGVTVNLKVYQGWSIRETVDAFRNRHELSENDGEAIYTEIQKNMPLVTLQVQGPDGATIDPPLRLLNGQSPDVVSLEYCYTHNLDIPTYAHELNKALRARVPEELQASYPPLRKVMLVIPFETADGVQRTPFYENDVPASFSENLCTQFNGGEGCYDRVLNYVNSQINAVNNNRQATKSEAKDNAAAQKQQEEEEQAAAAKKAQEEKEQADAAAAAAKKAQEEKEQADAAAAAAKKAQEKKEQEKKAQTRTKTTSKRTISATTDDSNAKGEDPLDQVRAMLRPTWESVYEAMGSPEAVPSDPLFLVVPVFAVIGLLLGVSTSSGGKNSSAKKKVATDSNAAAAEKSDDKKSTKSGNSSRSKRSSTPSSRGRAKKTST
jgi:chemotaxis protein histidine kinase CheA